MSFRTPYDDDLHLQGLRQVIDLMVCFVIAVILLRGFVLEGYLISTGSMAPGLLGFHKHVVCPSCQYAFAFGVSFDDSVDPSAMSAAHDDGTRKNATCPNCGQVNIDVSGVPTSHGDQLLVQKHVYDFRRPDRWETIVFRNPASPGEAYVKRVTGLPGEEIQVIDGDIWINGELARKDYRTQRDMRIGVSDLHFLADSEQWEMPWQVDSGWQLQNGVLHSTGALASDHLITFRPWRWFGGNHLVETPLAADEASGDWTEFLKRFERIPVSLFSRLDYDVPHQVLRWEGVMPPEVQRDLTTQATSEAFRNAVYRLAALSHLAAVTDHYGYNAMVSSPEYPVSDLMLRTLVSWDSAPEEVRVTVPVDGDVYSVRVFPRDGRIHLESADGETPLQTGTFQTGTVPTSTDASQQESGLELEVSNFDHQIIVAVNQQPCFPPLVLNVVKSTDRSDSAVRTDSPREVPQPVSGSLVKTRGVSGDSAENAGRAARGALRYERQQRWSVSVRGEHVRLQGLQMFRDVYYTPGRARNAVDEPYRVESDSYFVQGDNSPVSSDSRNWTDACVPHRLLLGKPFLLHLPSRPAVLEVGSKRWPIRIPDWSRIRYIN